VNFIRAVGKAKRREGIVEEQSREEHTNPNVQPLCPNWVALIRHFASAYPLTVIGVSLWVKGMPARSFFGL
jgi:hypothetical protein